MRFRGWLILLLVLSGCLEPELEREPFEGFNSWAILDGDPVGSDEIGDLRKPLDVDLLESPEDPPIELGQVWLLRRRTDLLETWPLITVWMTNVGPDTLCSASPGIATVFDEDGESLWDADYSETTDRHSPLSWTGSVSIYEGRFGLGESTRCLAPGESALAWDRFWLRYDDAASVRLGLRPGDVFERLEPRARVLPISYTVDPHSMVGSVELLLENQGDQPAFFDRRRHRRWLLALLDDEGEPLFAMTHNSQVVDVLEPGEQTSVLFDAPFAAVSASKILFAGRFADFAD